MSTFMAKKESVERKWYVLDAKGKPLGRTAAAAANILRGKHRPESVSYTHLTFGFSKINGLPSVRRSHRRQHCYISK